MLLSLRRRFAVSLTTLLVLVLVLSTARAQLPEGEEQRLKSLTDPESIKKKFEKEKTRPPLEVFRSQIAPNDLLPFVKANHWASVTLEARSNYNDFVGSAQTTPVMMTGLPQEIVFRREVRLSKAQTARVGFQMMLPKIPKEISIELTQPDAIRPDEVWPASLRPLEPHQMQVVVLTKEPTDAFAPWGKLQAFYPYQIERGDQQVVDRMRYYRLVLPMDPEKPPLASHPLTWTTISHIIWDGLPPDHLNPAQQEALLDWLHWGGQLVIVGGPGPSFSLLKDSFLAPYLPGEATGESALLKASDLAPMSAEYPPPVPSVAGLSDEGSMYSTLERPREMPGGYRPRVPIRVPESRPLFLATLKPNPDAVVIPLGAGSDRVIGVEQRVGRGRILMLGFSMIDPSIASWPGFDTFFRRVVLRRPEESAASRMPYDGLDPAVKRYSPLPGPDLSWFRYLTRDLGSPVPVHRVIPSPADRRRSLGDKPMDEDEELDRDVRFATPDAAVAEWVDNAYFPRLCRDVLEAASGIKVPGPGFVLKVVLAYILALVPLNWLICRYIFGRRELAWIVVPILSLGFAIGVERAAAYDIGYNTACDEVDVLEIQGGYPRAHVSRFASLFSTGRTRYTISYPDNPSALALPFDNGRSLRGEDISSAAWRSFPVPALEGFLVQPRSLAMFRAEEMIALDGAITLESDKDGRRIVNGSGLKLQDAVVVDLAGPKERTTIVLGDIAPGQTIALKDAPRTPATASPADALQPGKFLRLFQTAFEDRPENRGEIRLIAWLPKAVGGQMIEPPVDRHRGLTAVVVHLRNGPPPTPDGPIYYDGSRVEVAPVARTKNSGSAASPGRRNAPATAPQP